ncbi:putative gamma-glutamylcyclotransferase CG2811 [Galendromus occidentalis]|uniref:Gamma-glutamylcyclotransferase family protein n=1 Tax=Galendromus occidentalis TaxID=34638 RepID=A0AAJ6VUU2_9ACAR|nr:putative gamma-glutamylcyclotransferase CG2811 [Galendromus occidentalis]
MVIPAALGIYYQNISMPKVFFYGTLKRGEPNEHVLRNPGLGLVSFIAEAKTVQKFPLTIASEFNLPYLLLKPGQGNRIHGEIFEVENLSILDEFESCPRYYTRVEELVELENGELINVWLYALEGFKLELLERPLLSSYSSSGTHGLAYRRGAGQNPQHRYQVMKSEDDGVDDCLRGPPR